METILVLGCQRSGTTLMGQILGSHSRAVLLDETDALESWADAWLGGAPENELQPLFEECCRLAATKYSDPKSRFDDAGRLLPGVRFVVLKAPNLTYRFDALSRLMPNARVVHMLRDIRDVVASVQELSEVPILANQIRLIGATGGLERWFARELADLRRDDGAVPPHVKMALVARIKMGLADRFSELGFEVVRVRYEDLVRDAGGVVPPLLARLGLEADLACLRHQGELRGKGPGGTRRDRSIDAESVGKWSRCLEIFQAREVWSAVSDFMEPLGYRWDAPSSPVPAAASGSQL